MIDYVTCFSISCEDVDGKQKNIKDFFSIYMMLMIHKGQAEDFASVQSYVSNNFVVLIFNSSCYMYFVDRWFH